MTGDEKSGKIKINFTEDPLKIGKVSKERILIVTSSQVFLYGHKNYCHFATWNSKTPITAAATHVDISRVFFGHEDGRIRVMKISGSGFTNDEVFDSSISQKDCAILAMHCDGKTLASVDESGWVTVWNIEVNNQLLFSKKLQDTVATSVCVTPETILVGTTDGLIIGLEKDNVKFRIQAHTGALTSIVSKADPKVSPQLCISTAEDGRILLFTSSGSVIKSELIGDYILTGVNWESNGKILLSAYGSQKVISHLIC